MTWKFKKKKAEFTLSLLLHFLSSIFFSIIFKTMRALRHIGDLLVANGDKHQSLDDRQEQRRTD